MSTPSQYPDISEALLLSLSMQGYVVWDDFLPESVIQALRNEAEQRYANQRMRAAKTGLMSNAQLSSIRGDHIDWLDENDAEHQGKAIDVYFKQMYALKEALNQQLFMNVQSLETHFAVYPIGGAYQKHLDQFSHGANAKSRQLSSILYLNKDWQAQDGGELRLYLDNNHHLDILPTAGRLVLFLSSQFWHEVRPAKRERASLTGWFRTRNQSVL